MAGEVAETEEPSQAVEGVTGEEGSQLLDVSASGSPAGAPERREPRGNISMPEAIIMLMLTIIVDVIEIILTFFLANPASIPLDFLVMGIIQFWLWMKGAKSTWALAGNLIEFIPYLDVLPTRTVTLLITIHLTNHQKTATLARASRDRISLPNK